MIDASASQQLDLTPILISPFLTTTATTDYLLHDDKQPSTATGTGLLRALCAQSYCAWAGIIARHSAWADSDLIINSRPLYQILPHRQRFRTAFALRASLTSQRCSIARQ